LDQSLGLFPLPTTKEKPETDDEEEQSSCDGSMVVIENVYVDRSSQKLFKFEGGEMATLRFCLDF
jgi:hypothetical protein